MLNCSCGYNAYGGQADLDDHIDYMVRMGETYTQHHQVN
jgi:hypothetical protein